MYLGSCAECCPASKTPKRVQADPAISASPLSPAAIRLRPPSRAPGGAGRGEDPAGPHQPARLTGVQRLGGQAHRAFHPVLGGQLDQGAGHGQPAGRPRLSRRRQQHAEPTGGGRGRADEHERQLPVGVVPGRRGGVGQQHRGVRRRRPGRDSRGQPRRSGGRAEQAAQRTEPAGQQLRRPRPRRPDRRPERTR